MTTARLLPSDEWYKLADRAPFDAAGLPDALHWVIPVVEVDGRVVASCAIFDTVHWDAFTIDDQYQHNPTVFRQLLTLAVETLQEHGVPGVHITVPDDRPELMAMVEHFGFIRAPGVLFFFPVPLPAKD